MRQTALRLAGITGMTALLVSCATREALRTEAEECDRLAIADCGRYSIERAKDEYVKDGKSVRGPLKNDQNVQGPYNYLLGFVEFDDHGAQIEPKQLDNLLELIREEPGDLAIVVYVHGWKHNAADADNDVKEFRWVLRGLDAVEQARPEGQRRKVVGVYAGWRGASLHPAVESNPVTGQIAKAPKQLTFWTRKNAAHRVAKGSIRDLFAAVRDVQRRHNGAPVPSGAGRCGDTRLVLIGHSFGGLIVYDAVHQHLIESARAGLRDGGPVDSYGNMVVLLNPAFEGVAYDSIHRLAAQRGRYADGQAPVLVTFQSENDWATGNVFPIGRAVSTTFERPRTAEQRRENWQAVGHVERFQTHRLELTEGQEAAPRRVTTTASPESEPRPALAPERQAQRTRALDATRDAAGVRPSQEKLSFRDGRVRLRHLSDSQLPPDSPFWVVSTDPNILYGHNEIWNDDFLVTLNELYTYFVQPSDAACATPPRRRAAGRSPAVPLANRRAQG